MRLSAVHIDQNGGLVNARAWKKIKENYLAQPIKHELIQ